MAQETDYPDFIVKEQNWQAYDWAEKLPTSIIEFFRLGKWHETEVKPNALDTAEFKQLYDNDADFRKQFDEDSLP